MTFSTTAVTKSQDTVTVDASVLATSNGQSGAQRVHLGSTSKEDISNAKMNVVIPSVALLMTMIAGAFLLV